MEVDPASPKLMFFAQDKRYIAKIKTLATHVYSLISKFHFTSILYNLIATWHCLLPSVTRRPHRQKSGYRIVTFGGIHGTNIPINKTNVRNWKPRKAAVFACMLFCMSLCMGNENPNQACCTKTPSRSATEAWGCVRFFGDFCRNFQARLITVNLQRGEVMGLVPDAVNIE